LSAVDKARDALELELDACVEHVRGLTATASELSEREVTAAVASLAELFGQARSNVDTLKQLSAQFSPKSTKGQESLHDAVRGQSEAMTWFLASLQQALVQQHTATTAIVEAAQKIGRLVARIEVLSLDLRMLTINARLEAVRWGEQGAAFATVATGMRNLTGEVQHVNEEIGTVSSTLSALASRVVENEGALQGLGEELGRQVGERVDALRSAYEATAGALQRSAERAHCIVDVSNSMLTKLQFQDRVAQTLREVDATVVRTRAVGSSILENLVEGGDDEEMDRAIERVRATVADARIRISRESELDSSDRAMASGVVEFF
jgi:methyl-accepting chemotaxis protein